ncbi:GNAT family N-acetyltransferase [Boseongicola aestuarii]|uniref:N-acetyltransferase domain-containing protein n=1 Tax=Boseongicola aestuarii TaxID=1470561 RepID=A0A238J012_9RHOB|nr:GNAT family N-acetyltransferase [Boseongicola aestuarii]SMX24059.1 hypothetical protein BOA8489_02174 [Boseongicola aestuarii]
MFSQNRYFGTLEQQGLERRADLLWQIVQDDPSYCFHGRAVGLLKNRVEDVAAQIALARLQGLGPSPQLTPEIATARIAEIKSAGLLVEVQERWSADEAGVAAASDFLRQNALPTELSVHEIGVTTSAEEYDKLDDLTQSCGILLPASAFLRGDAGPAVCLFAKTSDGRVIGFAAAIVQATRARSEQGKAWWGFLSTNIDWRGRGIAKFLGATAMVSMAKRHGLLQYETGILAENAASIGVSKNLGFSTSGLLDLLAIDNETLSKR